MIATSCPDVHLVTLADQGDPLEGLLSRLTAAEHALAPPADLGRRHYALGRAVAHAAVDPLVGPSTEPFEILRGKQGEPVVMAAGRPAALRVSITHSGRLVAACAWDPSAGLAAGVDLEPIRPGLLGQGDYLFSPREKALLATSGDDPALAQLAAWTAKEATWKTLWPHQPRHPAAVELVCIDLSVGRAGTSGPGESLGCPIHVTISTVAGPDGDYLLALAVRTHKRQSQSQAPVSR
jgi:4'-phosphopantetheinyl transferase EntD